MSQTAAEKAALLQIIADCKAAVKRHDDSSDSDETDVAYGTNRGNKLKRKARQVHAGTLDEPTGKKLTPELIDFNGRQRMILYRNIARREEPEVQTTGRKRKQKQTAGNTEDDTPPDEDPYTSIHLETLLAPAVEPRDIPNHPALSLPYKSRHLTDLCEQALDIICAEHKHLVTIKRLLTHLLGDDPWVTGDKMESVEAPKYIQEAQRMIEDREKTKTTTAEEESAAAKEPQTQSTVPDNDVEMVDTEKTGESSDKPATEVPAKSPIPKLEHPSPPDGFLETTGEASTARSSATVTAQSTAPAPAPAPAPTTSASTDADAMQVTGTVQTTLPAGVDPYEIVNSTSPWFYPPGRDEDARNFGLPAQEAEETRQLLLLAVQKEEEFIRGLERVRAMLLKADRQRKHVWNWCRADGAPEQSDGEDYVDLEYWELKEGDLVKGAEEEEEEDPKGKKTARASRRG
ncbi:hypothetical protein H072_3165 [Dactylellina haptotyla CBS 200.50]|uniref:Transcriptional regulatory protein RXT2 N-terminal domain-containing protein n=1 Tax=Dactylellina haptotyla (strain CBS 200.50) TaxID=1284197 RepID=S8C5F1_DACHA|nr:hypothetical protein H072_3165 [Dactylellina haptotyla CBS 200.50]